MSYSPPNYCLWREHIQLRRIRQILQSQPLVLSGALSSTSAVPPLAGLCDCVQNMWNLYGLSQNYRQHCNYSRKKVVNVCWTWGWVYIPVYVNHPIHTPYCSQPPQGCSSCQQSLVQFRSRRQGKHATATQHPLFLFYYYFIIIFYYLFFIIIRMNRQSWFVNSKMLSRYLCVSPELVPALLLATPGDHGPDCRGGGAVAAGGVPGGRLRAVPRPAGRRLLRHRLLHLAAARGSAPGGLGGKEESQASRSPPSRPSCSTLGGGICLGPKPGTIRSFVANVFFFWRRTFSRCPLPAQSRMNTHCKRSFLPCSK